MSVCEDRDRLAHLPRALGTLPLQGAGPLQLGGGSIGDKLDTKFPADWSVRLKECEINPFKTNFSLTFSRKTEYIFLSYVSIEELFRK